MTSLITNIHSQAAQSASRVAERLHAQALHRLSTGTRVNSAQDDAAGLAVGTRMSTAINAAGQLIQGISNGISLAQVAENGLQNTSGLLQRMRQLAVQAATGTLTPSDRSFLNFEFQALNVEIDRNSRDTHAFGRTPLAAPKPEPVATPVAIGNTRPITEVLSPNNRIFNSGLASLGYIPKGYSDVTINLDSFGADDDIQIFTADGKHLVGTPVLNGTDAVWASNGINSASTANSRIMNSANAFALGASYDGSFLAPQSGYNTQTLPTVNQHNGMTLAFSGDGHSNNPRINLEKVTINTVTENLVVMVIGNGSFSANGSWTEPPAIVPSNDPFSEDTQITLSVPTGQDAKSLTISATPADTLSLGTASSHIATANGAVAALDEIDAALQKVNGYAVNYGAVISRLSSAGDNLQKTITESSSSRSRILDTDYAIEATKLAKQQILGQASNAMLAQANGQPRQVLTLLEMPNSRMG